MEAALRTPGHIIVLGPPNSGKTKLLSAYAEELACSGRTLHVSSKTRTATLYTQGGTHVVGISLDHLRGLKVDAVLVDDIKKARTRDIATLFAIGLNGGRFVGVGVQGQGWGEAGSPESVQILHCDE